MQLKLKNYLYSLQEKQQQQQHGFNTIKRFELIRNISAFFSFSCIGYVLQFRNALYLSSFQDTVTFVSSCCCIIPDTVIFKIRI